MREPPPVALGQWSLLEDSSRAGVIRWVGGMGVLNRLSDALDAGIVGDTPGYGIGAFIMKKRLRNPLKDP